MNKKFILLSVIFSVHIQHFLFTIIQVLTYLSYINTGTYLHYETLKIIPTIFGMAYEVSLNYMIYTNDQRLSKSLNIIELRF